MQANKPLSDKKLSDKKLWMQPLKNDQTKLANYAGIFAGMRVKYPLGRHGFQ